MTFDWESQRRTWEARALQEYADKRKMLQEEFALLMEEYSSIAAIRFVDERIRAIRQSMERFGLSGDPGEMLNVGPESLDHMARMMSRKKR
jgi:hypothetical protein